MFVFTSVWVMVFNATFNNVSVILWRSVLLVEEAVVQKCTMRKPLTDRNSLTNFITKCCIEYTSPWIQTYNVSSDRYLLNSWM
jgi:hypothetical protein